MATKNYGIIELGYTKYVLPIDDAMQVINMLTDAGVYTADYIKDEVSGTHSTVHKIVPATMGNRFTIQVLPTHAYKAYLLAGEKEGNTN